MSMYKMNKFQMYLRIINIRKAWKISLYAKSRNLDIEFNSFEELKIGVNPKPPLGGPRFRSK